MPHQFMTFAINGAVAAEKLMTNRTLSVFVLAQKCQVFQRETPGLSANADKLIESLAEALEAIENLLQAYESLSVACKILSMAFESLSDTSESLIDTSESL